METLSVYLISEIVIEAWAIPGSVPTTFRIDHVKQLLEGFTKDSDYIASLIGLPLLQPYISVDKLNLDGLLHLLCIVAFGQEQGRQNLDGVDETMNGKYDYLSCIVLMFETLDIDRDLRKILLHFYHLGIPKAPAWYFESCLAVLPSDTRSIKCDHAIELWGVTHYSSVGPAQHEKIVQKLMNIWNILPKYPGGRTIDYNACIIGVYLAGITSANYLLPYSLPSHLYYIMFMWFHETVFKEEDQVGSPGPQALELLQNLNIDAIVQAISENIKNALQNIHTSVAGFEVSETEHLQSTTSSISSTRSAFHHIRDVALNVSNRNRNYTILKFPL
ncbi:hypothetical protein M422DRAFT_51293 [Sphaerobolus stellatus SS14]|uniref:Uncharacterized protein n=1 Tax=Sphaerobolus stellatus (strain SS14) TaxID=990650 RepID=A0A0C9VF05_SPHS4|nr:hypothetical protein M422DRAFT_51293 [Sphaerobolus stellatus SS14]